MSWYVPCFRVTERVPMAGGRLYAPVAPLRLLIKKRGTRCPGLAQRGSTSRPLPGLHRDPEQEPGGAICKTPVDS